MNPNLPVDKQDIDDIVDIEHLTLEQLAEAHENFDHDIKHLEAGKVEIRKTILEKMEADSEELGNYIASKVKKYKFLDLTLEQAEQLGFIVVKKTINVSAAKKAHLNGADLGKVEIAEILVMRKKKEVDKNG